MANILLVVGNAGSLTAGDIVIQTSLENAGHVVTLRSDESPEDFSGQDGIWVSESITGGTLGTKYSTANIPIILSEGGKVSDFGFGSAASSVNSRNWDVEDEGNPCAGGLLISGNPHIVNSNVAAGNAPIDGTTSPDILMVMSVIGVTVSVGTLELGEQRWNGGTVESRRAYIGIRDPGMALITASGQSIIDGCIGDLFSGGVVAPTITSVGGDNIVAQGELAVPIVGAAFGSVQGTGTVIISPTDNIGDASAQTQVVTGWADLLVNFDCDFTGTGIAEQSPAFLFVTNDSGGSNAAGFVFTRHDVTEPLLTNPNVTGVSGSTATGNVTTDDGTGTLYGIVSTLITAPSIAEIQAGQEAGGGAAAWAGNQTVVATGAQAMNATGLASGTNYYFYFQQQDAATNDSLVVGSAQFTTLSSTVTFNIAGGANLTGLQVAVFDGYDVGVAPLLAQFIGETSDGSADVEVDLSATSAQNGDPLSAIITDYTTSPTAGSSGAVCFATAVVT